MTPPEAKKYLFDMQQAAKLVAQFTASRTLDSYRADIVLRSAVERQLQILGEALYQLNRLFPTIAQQITDHQAIIHFRHVLVHGYDRVRDEIVWGIIQNDLAQLQIDLQALLK